MIVDEQVLTLAESDRNELQTLRKTGKNQGVVMNPNHRDYLPPLLHAISLHPHRRTAQSAQCPLPPSRRNSCCGRCVRWCHRPACTPGCIPVDACTDVRNTHDRTATTSHHLCTNAQGRASLGRRMVGQTSAVPRRMEGAACRRRTCQALPGTQAR